MEFLTILTKNYFSSTPYLLMDRVLKFDISGHQRQKKAQFSLWTSRIDVNNSNFKKQSRQVGAVIVLNIIVKWNFWCFDRFSHFSRLWPFQVSKSRDLAKSTLSWFKIPKTIQWLVVFQKKCVIDTSQCLEHICKLFLFVIAFKARNRQFQYFNTRFW